MRACVGGVGLSLLLGFFFGELGGEAGCGEGEPPVEGAKFLRMISSIMDSPMIVLAVEAWLAPGGLRLFGLSFSRSLSTEEDAENVEFGSIMTMITAPGTA